MCSRIGFETGSATQDYIQLYEWGARLLCENLELEYVQQTASRILEAVGADDLSAPAA